MKIGHILKAKLGIPDSDPIRYEVHKDSAARTGSSVKPRHVIPPAPAMNGNTRTRKLSTNNAQNFVSNNVK